MPKKEKALSDEEKAMLNEQSSLKAAEEREKHIERSQQQLKERLEQEENFTKINLNRLNTQWREILRRAKSEELAKEITILSQTFSRAVEHKDAVVQSLLESLGESERQTSTAVCAHMRNIDSLIDFHDCHVNELTQRFDTELEEVKAEFFDERQQLLAQHEQQIGDLRDILFAMQLLFEDREADAYAEFNTKRDELRTQTLESRSALKATLEGQIAELWDQFQLASKNYEHTTADKKAEFDRLRLKDKTSADVIDAQDRKLTRIQDRIQAFKLRLSQSQRDMEQRNKELKQEKDTVMKHLQNLKLQMARSRDREKENVTELTVESRKAENALKEVLAKADAILKQAEVCRKLETDAEKVLPFYADTVKPEEIAEAKGETLSPPEPLPESTQLRPTVFLPDNTQASETTALENFWKRYNKALLDKLAIDKEKQDLQNENARLRSLLKQYLDGISVSDEILSSDNTLLIVNNRTNALPRIPVGDLRVSRPTVVEAAHIHVSATKTFR
eukprot:m.213574 g.213574  ORF g.213574 m.213574 type:complete len:506 (+) comp27523_c0_seq1:125-1642(+)